MRINDILKLGHTTQIATKTTSFPELFLKTKRSSNSCRASTPFLLLQLEIRDISIQLENLVHYLLTMAHLPWKMWELSFRTPPSEETSAIANKTLRKSWEESLGLPAKKPSGLQSLVSHLKNKSISHTLHTTSVWMCSTSPIRCSWLDKSWQIPRERKSKFYGTHKPMRILHFSMLVRFQKFFWKTKFKT